MNKIVIINGQGGAGKDTFVNLCKKHKSNIYNISTIDYVKDIAYSVGWDGAKDEKGRKLLSDLKAALTTYDNIPFNSVCNQIENISDIENDAVIFIHCREPEEICKFKLKYDAIALLVLRGEIHNLGNYSDNNVLLCNYDYQINNNGSLTNLENDAIIFLEKLEKGEI